MKPYRGIVKGNTVILEETPEGAEGAEAVVLLKVSEKEDEAIVQRQKAMLQKGFPMGKLLYKKREELHRGGNRLLDTRKGGSLSRRIPVWLAAAQSVSGAKPALVGFFLDLQLVFYSAHAGDLRRQFLGACLLIG